jgi:hypothetical protein
MCCLLGLHGFLAVSYALRLQDYRLFYFQSSKDNLTTFGNVFSSFGWSIALVMDCLRSLSQVVYNFWNKHMNEYYIVFVVDCNPLLEA